MCGLEVEFYVYVHVCLLHMYVQWHLTLRPRHATYLPQKHLKNSHNIPLGVCTIFRIGAHLHNLIDEAIHVNSDCVAWHVYVCTYVYVCIMYLCIHSNMTLSRAMQLCTVASTWYLNNIVVVDDQNMSIMGNGFS